MNNIEKIKAEIERRKNICEGIFERESDTYYQGKAVAYGELLSFIDSRPEENPSEDLEEAAREYAIPWDLSDFEKGESLFNCYDMADAFKAGAEWQKEQDQPITGNSLEQEWLRYVDRKKKECRGELPCLGEYGWLQIARHFANWQKKKDRETIELAEEHAILAGRVQMKEEMMKDAVDYKICNNLAAYPVIHPVIYYEVDHLGLKYGDKVKLIIVKED